MESKHLYLYTIGCQMNVNDSELMAAKLRDCDYIQTDDIRQADLILVNTCSVRAKAEQKVFSFLGRLAGLKRKNPELIIGVGGCVAQQEGEHILKRAPMVDLVFGTRAIGRLPRLVEEVQRTGCRLVDIDMAGNGRMDLDFSKDVAKEAVSGFVTIMRGCDNFCTYCVVPYVRGRETSRTPEEILAEIRSRAAAGMREATLLGQNVNSYGKKEGLCTFSELLARADQVEDLWRLRFTTSHPKDLSEALIGAFGELQKLCHHIHLPVQSGSNRILQKMNRDYTREEYREKVRKLRNICPDIAITSDMIVGFPGESREDFEDTLDLVREIEFDGLFAFAYSDRPNAPAARFKDKIPEEERHQRLLELLALQEKYTSAKNQKYIGKIVPVLVEGFGKKQEKGAKTEELPLPQWTGRTSTNKIVHFSAEDGWREKDLTGVLVDVRIETGYSHSLRGRPIRITTSDFIKEGDETHVT